MNADQAAKWNLSRSFASIAIIFVLAVLLESCSLFQSRDQFIYKDAQIESIDVQVLESMPVQVHVVAHGFVGDGCTEIYQITKKREESAFFITITTRRPADAICTQIAKMFDEMISLDVQNLPAGRYSVDVNGMTKTFEFSINNSPPPNQ